MATATSLLLIVFLALFGSGARAILVPGPDVKSHDYKVAVSHFPLIDSTHKDPYKPTEDRRIMVSIFMPVAKSTCSNECQNSYMPPDTARICNEQFLLNAPEGIVEQMNYKVCCGNTADIDAAKLPVVVLEPHTDTSRLLYANLARYISANGVAVILLDHPGESAIVEFTHSHSTSGTVYNSGTVQLSNFSPLTSWNATIDKALSTRTQDMTFALSELSSLSLLKTQFPYLRLSSPLTTTRHAIIGHGLGGTLATALSLSSPHVSFSINLSGSGPPSTTTSATPAYFLGRADFHRATDINWPATWARLTGPATEFTLHRSDIFDFADLPVIVELAQNEGGVKGVRARGVGTSGAVGYHAVACFVEGIVKKEFGLGDGKAVSECVRMFADMVPALGGEQVAARGAGSAVRKASSGAGLGRVRHVLRAMGWAHVFVVLLDWAL